MTVDVGPSKYKHWIYRVYMFGIIVAVVVSAVGARIR